MTSLAGRVAIRAALFNHRTTREDIECLVTSVLEIGRQQWALLSLLESTGAEAVEDHEGQKM
jgi:hypothetical protein